MGIAAHRERRKRGRGKIHISGEESQEKREERRLIGKSTWYKPWAKEKGIFSSSQEEERKRETSDCFPFGRKKRKSQEIATVLNVQRTENGSLVKKFREKEKEISNEYNFRVKFVEMPGNTLASRLISSSTSYNCHRDNCLNCNSNSNTREKSMSCTRSNILYKAICLKCKEEREKDMDEDEIEKENKRNEDERTESVYIGESSKSLYKRSQQHIQRLRGTQKDSFILRHMISVHQEVPREQHESSFKFKILEFHRKPLERMIAESTEIKRYLRFENKKLLNSKLEYNRTIIPDITEEAVSVEEIRREEEVDNIIDDMRKEKMRNKGEKRKPDNDNNTNKKQRISFQEDGSEMRAETVRNADIERRRLGVSPDKNGRNGPSCQVYSHLEQPKLRVGGNPSPLTL